MGPSHSTQLPQLLGKTRNCVSCCTHACNNFVHCGASAASFEKLARQTCQSRRCRRRGLTTRRRLCFTSVAGASTAGVVCSTIGRHNALDGLWLHAESSPDEKIDCAAGFAVFPKQVSSPSPKKTCAEADGTASCQGERGTRSARALGWRESCRRGEHASGCWDPDCRGSPGTATLGRSWIAGRFASNQAKALL